MAKKVKVRRVNDNNSQNISEKKINVENEVSSDVEKNHNDGSEVETTAVVLDGNNDGEVNIEQNLKDGLEVEPTTVVLVENNDGEANVEQNSKDEPEAEPTADVLVGKNDNVKDESTNTENEETIGFVVDGDSINNKRKPRISRLKLYKRVFASTLLAGGILLSVVACNSNKTEKDKNKQNSKNQVGTTNGNYRVIEPANTTANVNQDGSVELVENGVTEKEIAEEDYKVKRIAVSTEDIKDSVNNYYGYLVNRIEDNSNKLEIGELYSTIWMANSEYVSSEETDKMIAEGLIPADLTTLKTEVDNVMSLIISENASKVAVSEAFNKPLNQENLIEIDEMFLSESDKKVAEYSFAEYLKLIGVNDSQHNTTDTYINTRNFFNNCTQYDFNEIGNDSKYFRHDYPVNFVQASIGAQYLIKGIMGPEFIVYATSTGAVSESEAMEFQETIDDVEGPISYLNDKFNGICFENNKNKTYVK